MQPNLLYGWLLLLSWAVVVTRKHILWINEAQPQVIYIHSSPNMRIGLHIRMFSSYALTMFAEDRTGRYGGLIMGGIP